MAMSLGNGRQQAQINVTPMIDVLLVLIIIFMVITPLQPVGLKALVPQAPSADSKPAPAPRDIVVTVRGGGSFLLNQEPLDLASLHVRLARLFKNGANDVIFVRGERNLEFQEIARVIDIAHDVGIERIALMTT